VTRQYLILFGVLLGLRLAGGQLVSQPGYMDAYYYYHVGRNLYLGRGFVEDVIWNWLNPPPTITHPGNDYWMPLASVLIAGAFFVFGESFRAAQLPSLVASAALALFAYHLAGRVFKSEQPRIWAAVITAAGGSYFIYWHSTDNFALFGLAGALALYLASGLPAASGWGAVGAGALSGLAYLARPDGPLILALAVGWVLRPGTGASTRRRVGLAVLAVLGFCLVAAPWWARNLAAFGSPFPGGGLKAAWLREYNEVFSYGLELGPAYYLGWGLGPILQSKVSAALRNLNFFLSLSLVLLLPFGFLGAWRLRREPAFILAWAYILVLFVVLTLVFTFPSSRGTLFHSGVVSLPFFGVAIARGLENAIRWLARYRPRWEPDRAVRNIGVIVIGGFVVASIGLGVRAAGEWDSRFRAYADVAAWFRDHGISDPVMVVDPPGYYYVSGTPAIVVANNDLETTWQVCRRYRVRYLLLEPAFPEPWLPLRNDPNASPRFAFVDQVGDIKIFRVEG
jgi:hypothetical protein